jgi:hypothetical protein
MTDCWPGPGGGFYWFFTLPVPRKLKSTYAVVGTGYGYDAGNGLYIDLIAQGDTGGTGIYLLYRQPPPSPGAFAAVGQIGPTSPWTWTVGAANNIILSGTYEAA